MSSIYFNLAPLALITSTRVCVRVRVCMCVPLEGGGVRLPVKVDNKNTALAIIEFWAC